MGTQDPGPSEGLQLSSDRRKGSGHLQPAAVGNKVHFLQAGAAGLERAAAVRTPESSSEKNPKPTPGNSKHQSLKFSLRKYSIVCKTSMHLTTGKLTTLALVEVFFKVETDKH